MRIEDLAHSIVLHVFELLRKEHNYVVPEQIRHDVIERIKQDLDRYIPGKTK